MSIVRLVLKGKIVEERDMDRTPITGEVIWYNNNCYNVVEVHWREDGHASLLIRGDSFDAIKTTS